MSGFSPRSVGYEWLRHFVRMPWKTAGTFCLSIQPTKPVLLCRVMVVGVILGIGVRSWGSDAGSASSAVEQTVVITEVDEEPVKAVETLANALDEAATPVQQNAAFAAFHAKVAALRAARDPCAAPVETAAQRLRRLAWKARLRASVKTRLDESDRSLQGLALLQTQAKAQGSSIDPTRLLTLLQQRRQKLEALPAPSPNPTGAAPVPVEVLAIKSAAQNLATQLAASQPAPLDAALQAFRERIEASRPVESRETMPLHPQ